MEDYISKFGFKAAVFIVTSRDGGHALTEVKEIILSYTSITQVMVDSYCEILRSENSGAGLGSYHTDNYGSGLDEPDK